MLGKYSYNENRVLDVLLYNDKGSTSCKKRIVSFLQIQMVLISKIIICML